MTKQPKSAPKPPAGWGAAACCPMVDHSGRVTNVEKRRYRIVYQRRITLDEAIEQGLFP